MLCLPFVLVPNVDAVSLSVSCSMKAAEEGCSKSAVFARALRYRFLKIKSRIISGSWVPDCSKFSKARETTKSTKATTTRGEQRRVLSNSNHRATTVSRHQQHRARTYGVPRLSLSLSLSVTVRVCIYCPFSVSPPSLGHTHIRIYTLSVWQQTPHRLSRHPSLRVNPA